MAARMTAEDRLDVIDLIADYGFTLEAGDLDAFVNNFTPDGIWQGGGGTHVGREAIKTFVAGLVAKKQDGPEGHRHILGIPRVTGDGERCQAQTYVIIPGEGQEDSISLISIGTYRDEIVKLDGKWLFAHRHLQMFARRAIGG